MRILLLPVCTLLLVQSTGAQTFGPDFVGPYHIRSIGIVPGVPESFGAMAFKAGDSNTFLIGGDADQPSAHIYQIQVQRDTNGHIAGFIGSATAMAATPGIPPAPGDPPTGGIDGGLDYGPGNVLFYTTYGDNSVGEIKPGSTGPDKQIKLDDIQIGASGVSVGALKFVPAGFPGAGRLKITSYTDSLWYDTTVADDGSGTFDISRPTRSVSIATGPEGIFFVKAGSARFPKASVLIASYLLSSIEAYEIDANGDPVPATQRDFITGLHGATGATQDPVTGDFLFSSFSDPQVYVVGGFTVGTTTVAITAPADNSSFTAPAAFDLQVVASQTNGLIDHVDLYQNQQLVSTDNSAPYQFSVSGLAAGAYQFAAVAYDGSGGVTTSSIVHVTVTPAPVIPPSVSVTSVTNNTQVRACSDLLLVAEVVAGSGAITAVDFLDGTNRLAEITTPPYQFLVPDLDAGTHLLSARAGDQNGLSATSAPVHVLVNPLPLHTLVIHHYTPTQVSFCFQGMPGSNYIWETASPVAKPPWTPFLTNAGLPDVVRVTNALPATSTFYRTRLAP